MLSKKNFLFFLFLFQAHFIFSQNHSVNGRIVDENGDPLPGATIIVKGTTKGAVTDLDGLFSITTYEDTVLVASFSGYEKKEISINGLSLLDISLSPDIETLKEVIVIGYGSQEKMNVTGSVSTIKNDELTLVPVPNTSNLLSGRVPGVMSRQNSGLPGGENTQI